MRSKKEFMQTALLTPKAVGSVPVISPFANWDYYYLHKSISWLPETGVAGELKPVEVPAGFVTDLASTPAVFWSVLPPAEAYSHPAILHDYLYWSQECRRGEADEVFRVAMGELNVPGWKVSLIYRAVRLWGGRYWEENTKLKASGEKRILKRFPDDPSVTWEEWRQEPDVFRD